MTSIESISSFSCTHHTLQLQSNTERYIKVEPPWFSSETTCVWSADCSQYLVPGDPKLAAETLGGYLSICYRALGAGWTMGWTHCHLPPFTQMLIIIILHFCRPANISADLSGVSSTVIAAYIVLVKTAVEL